MRRCRSKPWATKSSARMSSGFGTLIDAAQVVDRLDERAAEHQGPDAIDGRPRQGGIRRVGEPLGQPNAPVAFGREQLRLERNAGLDDAGLARLAIQELVFASLFVHAREAGLGLAEERGETLKILLLPVLEGVIVALGTVDPDAEKGPRDPAGESFGIDLLLFGIVGDRQEVGRGVVGPEAVGDDQFADDLVVGDVLVELIAQPASRISGGGKQ